MNPRKEAEERLFFVLAALLGFVWAQPVLQQKNLSEGRRNRCRHDPLEFMAWILRVVVGPRRFRLRRIGFYTLASVAAQCVTRALIASHPTLKL